MIPGCRTQSFFAFKQRLVSHSNEVVVTFYDSTIMNAETLKKLIAFSVDNSEEVNQFRRFIRRIGTRAEDCRSDGSLTFLNEDGQLQRMEFNLQNRCVTIHPVDEATLDSDSSTDEPSSEAPLPSQHRLSRKGAQYLEMLRDQALREADTDTDTQ
ncbi:MAG: hypothetical protein JXX29_02855 [Deltaproteobacteria bacterium]|nr:hypothetical protein [Deltaproteobacteria bacterium]